jgi:hypothetical protein
MWRPIRPLIEQPGLFRRFVDLAPTAEAIREFANSFGLLLGGELNVVPPWQTQPVAMAPTYEELTQRGDPSDSLVSDGTLVPAEALDTWREHIYRMKAAVLLWEALNAQSDDAIIKLLRLEGTEHQPQDVEYFFYKMHLLNTSNPRALAKGILNTFVDEAIRIRHRRHWNDRGLVPLRFRDGLRVEPQTLLGAMWLQLATAIEEDKQFAQCHARGCRLIWFEKSTGQLGRREDAAFCSPRCRHTAYRDRKAQARQMFKQGTPIGHIAKELNTERDTVRAWVKGLKQQEA